MEKSGNPALGQSVLRRIAATEKTGTSTVTGTIIKSIILLVILMTGTAGGWRLAADANGNLGLVMFLGLFGAMAAALVTIFVPKASPFTAPVYAALEGIVLGAISQAYNTAYGGIVLQAVLLTFGVFVSTLYLYASGLVRVTEKMRSVIIIATAAVALYYVAALIAGLFGLTVPLIYDSGAFGIGFSVVVVMIAALNLLIDFDFIDRTAKSGMPKLFEWFGAFSLMVTLVWLYLEILRLLGKMRR